MKKRLLVVRHVLISLFALLPRINAADDGASSGENGVTPRVKLGLLNFQPSFFDGVEEGWNYMCQKIEDLDCYYFRRNDTSNEECISTVQAVIDDWLEEGVQGVAMRPPCKGGYGPELLQNLQALGLPVFVFASEKHAANATAYVGTNQKFMGRTMARLLRQLKPDGGTYAMVGRLALRDDAFIQEIERYNGLDDRPHWHEVQGNYTLVENPYLDAKAPGGYYGVMDRAATLRPDAIVFFKQTPMKISNYTAFVESHRSEGKDITYIGTDGDAFQLSYLNRRYVDGLVGQLPFEMGSRSAHFLYNLITTGELEDRVINTNIVAFNLIPIELPSVDVDENTLDGLSWVGFSCFGVVALSVIICIAWTMCFRKAMVVQVAQPFFLVMIAVGVLILSSSLVPLSFDDGGDPKPISSTWAVGVCMSIPWLAFVGFTVAFSALFSKTWRINRTYRAKRRVQFSIRDVLMPFILLVSSNILVLTIWTIMDPLMYVRQEHKGTDYWNRAISTYGSCRSDNAVVYLAPLAVLNFSVIVTACWQALEARDIKSEFGETRYITLAVSSLFQAFVTGVPVIVVVRDEPVPYYLLLSFMIFLLCMVLLWLIFLPKMIMQRNYAKMSPDEQRRQLAKSMIHSSENVPSVDEPDTSEKRRPYRSSLKESGRSSAQYVPQSRAEPRESESAVPESAKGGYSEFSPFPQISQLGDEFGPYVDEPADTAEGSTAVEELEEKEKKDNHTDKTIAFIGGPSMVSELSRVHGLPSVDETAPNTVDDERALDPQESRIEPLSEEESGQRNFSQNTSRNDETENEVHRETDQD